MPRWIAEIPCRVEFGDSAAKMGMADKDIGIEIKRHGGKQGIFNGIEILEDSRTEKIFRDKAIVNTEDVVVVGQSCGRGKSTVAEVRLDGVIETGVRFIEVRIQIKAEISDRLPCTVMMGVVRIENTDKPYGRGKIDRT